MLKCMRKQLNRKKIIFILIAVAVIVGIPLVWTLSQSKYNFLPQIIASHTPDSNAITQFPDTDQSRLTDTQQKIVRILKDEYALQPDGTKYSEGINEAWCADFVSWVFKKADVPLTNPNTGYWRIPGTYTLREYYEQENRFKPADSNYQPAIGDVMLYDNPSPFGQHVNIIINTDKGAITTIGGNEPGGIRIVKHVGSERDGFIGYGILE